MTRNDDMTTMKIYDLGGVEGVVRTPRHTNDNFTTKICQILFDNFILKI